VKNFSWGVVVFVVFVLSVTVYAGTVYRVKGVVKYSNGTPAAGLAVKAFHKKMGGEITLGSTRINNQGFYTIPFYFDADVALVIRIFDTNGKQLHQSQTVSKPAKDQTLNAILQTVTTLKPEPTAVRPIIRPVKIE